jgi:hypothetical protein
MIDKTIFHKDRLDFNGNHKIQKRKLSSILVLDLIIMTSVYDKEMTIDQSMVIAGVFILALVIFVLRLTRDYSKDTLIKEINDIKLRVNLLGNFIVRIKNTKRKVRVIDLGKNHMEVSKYIDFAKRNNLQIDYDEKILAQAGADL